MNKTRKCPGCGRQIYQFAQVCPYCKCETHFASIDETMAASTVEKDPIVVEESADSDVDKTEEKADTKEGHLSHVIRHLKEDGEKVKQEYDQKIGRRYSRSTILIGSVIAVLSLIVLGFFIAVQMMETKTFSLSSSVDNGLKEVIDSVETELYQSSTIVAKFPDRQRHAMFYLKDGHLYRFDAISQANEEIDLMNINPKAIVDFEGSGVLNAYLSTNEKYILIIASRNAGNTEFGFYRLGTDGQNLEVIDKGRVSPEKDGYVVRTDVRTATYDSNGDRTSGISSAEWEKVAPKVEKPKKTQENVTQQEERPKEHVSVTEQMKPSVDIATKPAVPVVPEKITIKPVSPAQE